MLLTAPPSVDWDNSTAVYLFLSDHFRTQAAEAFPKGGKGKQFCCCMGAPAYL